MLNVNPSTLELSVGHPVKNPLIRLLFIALFVSHRYGIGILINLINDALCRVGSNRGGGNRWWNMLLETLPVHRTVSLQAAAINKDLLGLSIGQNSGFHDKFNYLSFAYF